MPDIASDTCTTATVSVLVIADDGLARLGLEALVSTVDALTLAGSVPATDFDPSDVTAGIDVVVVDALALSVPVTEPIMAIRAKHADCRVLVLRGDDLPHPTAEALAAGASGVVARTMPTSFLTEAITRVAGDETVLDSTTAMDLAMSLQPARNDRRRAELSPREIEVLSTIANGRTNAQAAAELFVSTQTIKTHLARAYAKLGVRDRAAAVYQAAQRGLLDTTDE